MVKAKDSILPLLLKNNYNRTDHRRFSYGMGHGVYRHFFVGHLKIWP